MTHDRKIATGIYKTREELNERVKHYHELGRSNRWIGKHVKVSQPTVSRILNGDEISSESKRSQEMDKVSPLTSKLNSLWSPSNTSHLEGA